MRKRRKVRAPPRLRVRSVWKELCVDLEGTAAPEAGRDRRGLSLRLVRAHTRSNTQNYHGSRRLGSPAARGSAVASVDVH